MKRIEKRIVLRGAFALALLLAGMAYAEEQEDKPNDGAVAARTLTVDEAVTLAMENNMQLSSAAIDLRVKERAKDNAWNSFLPTAQVSGTLARTNLKETSVGGLVSTPAGISYVSQDIELAEKDRWSMFGGLSIALNLNAALVEGLRATRQNYEAGKLTFEQARSETERNVRKAFYGILVQEENAKLLREKLATGEERLKQTRVNYRNGVVPELTVLQAELAVETQKPALREAEIALEKQKGLFAFIIGIPVGTEIALSGGIDPVIKEFDGDELVSKYLSGRTDLAILEKNLELANTQARATWFLTYTPNVALSKSWQPAKSPIDGGEWKDSAGSFNITVSFDLIGLIPFSKAGQSLAEAEDNARKLEIALAQARYNGELEIRDLAKRLDKARSSIATMEMSVSIAEKAYRLTEQGYRAGTIEYLDLKDAETSLLQARLGVVSEKFNYLSTLLDLESAVNARLD